jgi:EAL domain-containing protein (putative c-di-GMP-specific phosphodiesterase class I)
MDLKSRNGTYVNHKRIDSDTIIQHGDILHIGDVEMRLIQSQTSDYDSFDESTMTIDFTLSDHFPFGVKELEELLTKEAISPVFQPIVNHDNSLVYGYELLSRGASDALPSKPEMLFRIAESVGMEVKLSELMRNKGIKQAAQYDIPGMLFVNTHPSELQNIDSFLKSLFQINKMFPSINLVVEIHEKAITDLDSIQMLKRRLRTRNMLLAYDDFGVGQSRLLELVEAAPDILKFDMIFIQHIDQAGSAKRELLQQLHQISKKLEIKTLAECVHHRTEYDVCKSIGFDYYQGYFFGKPSPPQTLL